MRRAYQAAVCLIAKPYIRREFIGWGKLLSLVAGYKRDFLWANAPEVIIEGKLHGYRMRLALDTWADRSTYFLDRWYDLEAQLILRDLIAEGSTIVDVGANRGMFALAAASVVGECGRVICFEPNPNCQRIFRDDIKDNSIENVVLHPFGLGDRDDTSTLTVPFQNSGSGTLGANVFSSGSETYPVQVSIKIGDHFLEGEKPALIKIDVEGFEHKALAGLSNTISANRPVVLHEVAPRLLQANGGKLSDICNFMEGFGYVGFRPEIERTGRWR